MNKEEIRKLLVAQISSDLETLVQSALAAKEAATHAESKAEDQYDTRGLEASYLAGAQSVRAAELEAMLALYRSLDFSKFSEQSPIYATALVELSCEGKLSYCFLMPQGGGRSIEFDGKKIQVITPQSPLGNALLGHKVGDEITVQTQSSRDYEITRVW